MKKVLIYLRVSDPNQEIRDSLIKQEEQVKKYCEFKGYHIYKTIKEVGSGRRDDRDGFRELEKEIEKNTFDILIFYELSRLARNTYVLHSLINSLRMKKIKFESVTESYLNSDSPTSKLMLSFMASMAEMESDTLSKRVGTRMKYYVSQGYWMHPAPKGYTLKDRILYIDKEEAEVVRSIYKSFIKEASYSKLCREYNLSQPGLKRVLTNVAYLGKTKWGFEGRDKDTGKRGLRAGGEIFEGKHEPIIDADTFNLVQELIKNKSDKLQKTGKGEFLLTGLLRHKGCRRRMSGKINYRSQKGGYKYYACTETGCYVSKSARQIEDLVLKTFKSYCRNLKTLNKIPQKKKSNPEEATLKILSSKRKRIVSAYLDGNLEREVYLEEIQKIDTQLKEAHTPVPKKLNPIQETSYTSLIKLVDNFDSKDNLEKNSILKLLIEEVIFIDKENIEVVFKI